MCKIITPSFKEQIIAYRLNHGMNETAKAFGTSWYTVNKIAPTTKLQKKMRISAGQRARWARIRSERDIRKALVEEKIKQKRSKIADLRAEIEDIENEIKEMMKAI